MRQDWAEAMIPLGDESIISITDHLASPARLNEGWRAVLRIQFDDVDPVEYPPDEFEGGLVPISAQQALAIADFAISIAAHSTCLVVHCKYGQSRSAGVAKAICQHLGLGFPPEYDLHNGFVYKLVLAALSHQSAGWPPPQAAVRCLPR